MQWRKRGYSSMFNCLSVRMTLCFQWLWVSHYRWFVLMFGCQYNVRMSLCFWFVLLLYWCVWPSLCSKCVLFPKTLIRTALDLSWCYYNIIKRANRDYPYYQLLKYFNGLEISLILMCNWKKKNSKSTRHV